MKRFVFLSRLQTYWESRQTAKCASTRIRSVLVRDRDLIGTGLTKKLSGELLEVLSHYFQVTDFSFCIHEGTSAEQKHCIIEAELAKI